MKNNFTLEDIEEAMNKYCSDCFHSCDECCLKDFINFNLSEYLKEVENE